MAFTCGRLALATYVLIEDGTGGTGAVAGPAVTRACRGWRVESMFRAESSIPRLCRSLSRASMTVLRRPAPPLGRFRRGCVCSSCCVAPTSLEEEGAAPYVLTTLARRRA